MELLADFFKVFVPLFVAIDPVGCVPLFVGLTADLPPAKVRRIVNQAGLVSLLIAVLFLFTGDYVFQLMSIKPLDFQIGGGLLLFIYAVTDIITTGRPVQRDSGSVGIVPIATPLIAGPALLTTIVLMTHLYGLWMTLAALLVNLLLVWLALRSAHRLASQAGRELMNGISKVLMVFLAGYGVMMVREGILTLLKAVQP